MMVSLEKEAIYCGMYQACHCSQVVETDTTNYKHSNQSAFEVFIEKTHSTYIRLAVYIFLQ